MTLGNTFTSSPKKASLQAGCSGKEKETVNLRQRLLAALKRGIRVPQIDMWFDTSTGPWTHGEYANPATWPWWVRCRFRRVKIDRGIGVRHKKITEIGFCREIACHPDRVPKHFESCEPRVYDRYYLYTRGRYYNVDLRIAGA